MATVIRTRELAVSFDNLTPVFDDVSFTVEEGAFVTLVGVSGAGKSTLLRVVADLIPPFKGSVEIEVAHTETAQRQVAMVFQSANLMPWRRVRDNITLGLEGINVPGGIKDERVRWTLQLVGLEGYEERWPYQLSGGERQRIGIARALAVDPDILLMDEPFGALDAITRSSLQDQLLSIWQETGKSVLFVTHDIEEAVYLGDRVLLLGDKPGRIVGDYPVALARPHRRDSQSFLKVVEDVRDGLRTAIDLASAKA